MSDLALATPINAHAWQRETNEHYVEPPWCSARLFEEEQFTGGIYDPCCGFGTIVIEALKQGKHAYGSDLVDRGWDSTRTPFDFLTCADRHDNIVCNPPFNIAASFADRALQVARRKVALIFPTARLNAAHWLHTAPLKRIWLMTPRPSMPPGHVIKAGEKPGGGKMDYCWLVFEHEFNGIPELRWLKRDKRADCAAHRGATMTAQQSTRFLTTYQTRGDSFQLGARSAPFTRSHSLGPRNESAPASMQTGIHTSPGLFATVSAMVTRRRKTSRSFLPARASFKLAKLAQAMLDVFAASYWLLYVALWIVVILGILPFTLFCLFLIQF